MIEGCRIENAKFQEWITVMDEQSQDDSAWKKNTIERAQEMMWWIEQTYRYSFWLAVHSGSEKLLEEEMQGTKKRLGDKRCETCVGFGHGKEECPNLQFDNERKQEEYREQESERQNRQQQIDDECARKREKS